MHETRYIQTSINLKDKLIIILIIRSDQLLSYHRYSNKLHVYELHEGEKDLYCGLLGSGM